MFMEGQRRVLDTSKLCINRLLSVVLGEHRVDGGTTGSCEVGSVAGEGTTCWVALLVCWLLKNSMHVLFLER
jgi:hypothetical protein